MTMTSDTYGNKSTNVPYFLVSLLLLWSEAMIMCWEVRVEVVVAVRLALYHTHLFDSNHGIVKHFLSLIDILSSSILFRGSSFFPSELQLIISLVGCMELLKNVPVVIHQKDCVWEGC